MESEDEHTARLLYNAPWADLSLPLSTCIENLWQPYCPECPGGSAYELISDAEERAAKELSHVVSSWMLIFDEFLVWFASVAAYLQDDLRLGRQPSIEKITYGLVIGAVVSQMTAIRKLVFCGLDVPAKQVLRSLCEYLDVLSLLIIKPELASLFQNTQDGPSSNKFWHAHISKRKIKKLISEHFLSSSSMKKSEYEKWKRDEEDILSMSAHPSYLACMAANYSFDDEITGLSMFGRADTSGVRTLRCSVFSAAEAVILLTHWIRSNQGNIELFDDSDVEDVLLTIVRNGGFVLMAALIGLCTTDHLHPDLAGATGT